MTFETATATEACQQQGEDRVAVHQVENRCVIVVADGAGGTGSGANAADIVIREVANHFESVHSADDWESLLRQIDSRTSEGESTAVIVDIRPFGIAGASVGDSQGWIFVDNQIIDLTKQQIRKPLLGSGVANPVGFTYSPLEGLLIVATDGFFNYAKLERVRLLLAKADFYEIPRRCIDLVRLPSGDLWDDTALVIARNSPIRRTRKRYELN